MFFFHSLQVETPFLLQLIKIKFLVHKWCCTRCMWNEKKVEGKVLSRIFKYWGSYN